MGKHRKINMQEEIKNYISKTLTDLGYPSVDFSVDLPKDISHGDFSSNVALVLSKQVGKNPIEVAQSILEAWKDVPTPSFAKIDMAGPGFINFHLSPAYISDEMKKLPQNFSTKFSGKKIITEFTDPNPFKQFHIGHLMSNAIGESVSRLYELGGADVTRVCYQGDIGPHVAKCIWGMIELTKRGRKIPDENDLLEIRMRVLGEAYVIGSNLYEDDVKVQTEIKEINKELFEKNDPTSILHEYYDKGRAWSLEYFDTVYAKLGTSFKHFFFESQTQAIGRKIVEDNIENGIFAKSTESDAIIYEGEKDGLHTRVFINSQGLPTYETKELGLAQEKAKLGDFDVSIVVTANEQTDYFKVLLAAMARTMPEIAAKTKHVAHGMMQFADGKMSSRKGNVITGDELLAQVEAKVVEKIADRGYSDADKDAIINAVSVGALKYSVLKQTPGKNIIFDFDKSISFEGDSGPYIQYAYTRAKSVLAKAGSVDASASNKTETYDIEKVLMRFEPIVKRAITELAPQHVASYLIELAGAFNSWYAQEKIIGDDNEAYKLVVTQKVAHTLERGLFALGIRVPEKM